MPSSLALAFGFVLYREALLLDEPTASLDPQCQSLMVDFLLDCSSPQNRACLHHELHTVEDIADRCVVAEALLIRTTDSFERDLPRPTYSPIKRSTVRRIERIIVCALSRIRYRFD
jgi:energy-coupling factor transporter ATP-binding protein EcfA2